MAIGDGVSAIASLTAGFGGFSPTALDGVENTRRQVEQAEEHAQRMRELRQKRKELEWARTSKPRTCTTDDGIVWTYVVVDDSYARITGYESTARTVAIPQELDGVQVYGIGPDALSRNEHVEEFICPDTVESIGSCAFRFCPNLKRMVFPENVFEFSVSWLQQCNALEELVLPGLLDNIDSAIFDNAGIKRLRIGRNVRTVTPGAFEKTQLDELELDPRNVHMRTDGAALYSEDGTVLIALCRPVGQYGIAPGCVKIAKKAFGNIASLESVTFPDTLRVVGTFAFARSGVKTVKLPDSVQVIGEKAFFHCKQVERVELNEGLVRIGDSAFEGSSLSALAIPASIREIGTSIVAHSSVVRSGPDATISISPDCPTLFLDGSGGLYRREDDGVHLIQLIDPAVTEFRAHPETRFVDANAFAYLPNIEDVAFGPGLEEVSASAFRVCSSLRRITLPDSVRVIGKDAFVDTQLEAIRIPASLEELGENALVTAGAHRFGDPPTLSRVDVGEGNTRFFTEAGMLCERAGDGVRVIVYYGADSDVVIPPEVTSIAPFAFSNARGVRTLRIPPSVKLIGTSGLGVWSFVEHIHIDLATPVEGRTSFDFRFPDTSRSVHSISLALGGSTWVNVPDIMAQYDNCVVNAHDYQGNGHDSISIYDQVTRIVGRLKDPILLTNVNKGMFERLVRGHLEEICVDVARHDDRELMDALIELGFVNEGNLERVIGAVGRLQDAAMTAYLLEVKRRRFGERAFDFEL